MEKTNKKSIWKIISNIVLFIILIVSGSAIIGGSIFMIKDELSDSTIVGIVVLSIMGVLLTSFVLNMLPSGDNFVIKKNEIIPGSNNILFFYKDLLLVDSKTYLTGMRALLKIKPVNDLTLMNKIALGVEKFNSSYSFKHEIRDSIHHDSGEKYNGISIKTWMVNGPIINVFRMNNDIVFIEMLINKDAKMNDSYRFLEFITSIIKLYGLSYSEGEYRIISNMLLSSDYIETINDMVKDYYIEGYTKFDGKSYHDSKEVKPSDKKYLQSINIKMEKEMFDEMLKTGAPEPSTYDQNR